MPCWLLSKGSFLFCPILVPGVWRSPRGWVPQPGSSLQSSGLLLLRNQLTRAFRKLLNKRIQRVCLSPFPPSSSHFSSSPSPSPPFLCPFPFCKRPCFFPSPFRGVRKGAPGLPSYLGVFPTHFSQGQSCRENSQYWKLSFKYKKCWV